LSKYRARNQTISQCRVDFLRQGLFLLGDQFRAARFQRIFRKKILWEAGIVAAVVIKKLRGSPAVVLAGNLHGCPDAVLEVVIRINGAVIVDLLVLRILRADHRADQKMRGVIEREAVLAAFAVRSEEPTA